MTKPKAMPGNVKIVRTGIAETLKAAHCPVARDVNRQIRTTYQEIGRQFANFKELVEQPPADLTRQSGRDFARRILWQVRTFDRARPEQQIRQTLSDESITRFVSCNIESNPSSVLRTIARSRLPCFPLLGLLPKRNREARSFYESEALDSG
jgi:hypothetical protein